MPPNRLDRESCDTGESITEQYRQSTVRSGILGWTIGKFAPVAEARRLNPGFGALLLATSHEARAECESDCTKETLNK